MIIPWPLNITTSRIYRYLAWPSRGDNTFELYACTVRMIRQRQQRIHQARYQIFRHSDGVQSLPYYSNATTYSPVQQLITATESEVNSQLSIAIHRDKCSGYCNGAFNIMPPCYSGFSGALRQPSSIAAADPKRLQLSWGLVNTQRVLQVATSTDDDDGRGNYVLINSREPSSDIQLHKICYGL